VESRHVRVVDSLGLHGMVCGSPEHGMMHQEGVGVGKLVEGVGGVLRPHIHHQHLESTVDMQSMV
jgi:hypothetical protein